MASWFQKVQSMVTWTYALDRALWWWESMAGTVHIIAGMRGIAKQKRARGNNMFQEPAPSNQLSLPKYHLLTFDNFPLNRVII